MKKIGFFLRLVFLILFFILLVSGKSVLWLGLFGISIIMALIFGRVYCGYVCPMNTIMIAVDSISKKMKIKTESIPKWLSKGCFAWIALIVSVAGIIITKKLLHINFSILIIWLIISVIVTLRYKPVVFHNLICPFGVIQRKFGSKAKFTTKVDYDKCIGCKLCERTCPSNAIAVLSENGKAEITTSLCFQCTNCGQACPKEAICYRK